MTLSTRVRAITLSTRLTMAMVGMVLATAAMVAAFGYGGIEATVLARALDELELHSELLTREMESHVRGAQADVLGFASAAALDGIVRARLNGGTHPVDGTSEAVWRQRMAERYVAELQSKPAYLQFRIVGVEDGGREIVRVERSSPGGAPRIVPDSELQRDQDYVQETIGFFASPVHVSGIDLNQAHGVVETPHVPVLRVATPVHTFDNKPFGLVILSLDMRLAFASIRTAARYGGHVYVVNDRGDYLVHSDPRREFGTSRLADEFPELAAVLAANDRQARLITDGDGARLGAVVAPVRLAGFPVAVIETVPYAAIMAPALAAQQSSLLAGLVAVFAALVLAVLLSHRITRPLVQMIGAVQGFSRGEPMALPLGAGGEVGMLARAFEGMASDVRNKTAALRREGQERLRTEAALEKYAERDRIFAAVVESAKAPIITKTLHGTITAWNAAAERLFQYTAVEALGSSIDIIVPPNHREEHHTILERIIRDELTQDFETVRVAKDGRRIDVSLIVSPIRSSAGEIVGIASITRDMTDQKVAEEKFRLAVESCPNGMVMIDSAGTIVLVNREIERLFGYRRDELVGQPVEILVAEGLRDQHARHRDAFAADPETRRMGAGRDLSGRRKDGSEFPVEVCLNPIYTRDGLLVLSVIVDISARKHAEEMFRLAVEACPSGMVMVDGNGVIAMVNTEIERLFGYRREELIGQPADLLVPERLRHRHAQHRDDFTRNSDGGRMVAGRDLHARRKDGTEFPVEVTLNPIHVGEQLLILSVIVDVSERNRIQQLKDEFVSTVSHELRTPLTSISASLALLTAADLDLPQMTKRLVTIAHSNSQRLVRLINDILDIEKIESGKVVFDLQRVEVRALIAQVIESSRALAEEYGVRLRFEESSAYEVHADPDRLMQVIANLLSNAIKFSPREADVVVAIEERGERARMTVRDHGPGIPETFRTRIFEKFAQADGSDARRKGGTGLGLSIVKEIVLRLGGEVGFCDAPGGGTTFYVELPCLESQGSGDVARGEEFDGLPSLHQDDAGAAAVIHDDLSAPLDGRTQLRVLHLDDDPDVLGIVAHSLEAEAIVVSVATIEQARLALDATHFDLAVVDLALGGSSGFDLLPALRNSKGEAIPVIIYSALAADPACPPQVQAVLTKSRASIDTLIATLRTRIAAGVPQAEREPA